MMVIETERLLLREFTHKDFQHYECQLHHSGGYHTGADWIHHFDVQKYKSN